MPYTSKCGALIPKTMNNELTVFQKQYTELQINADKNVDLTNPLLNTFVVSQVAGSLTQILTDDVINKVFRPLMNKKCGFMTDKPAWNKPNEFYANDVLRSVIIDATVYGLPMVMNYVNIIAGRMYITSEGTSYLLRKLGIVYTVKLASKIELSGVEASINYEVYYKMKQGETKTLKGSVNVKVSKNASNGAIRGKANKKAKEQLLEFCTSIITSDMVEATTPVTSIDKSQETLTIDVKGEEVNVKNLPNNETENKATVTKQPQNVTQQPKRTTMQPRNVQTVQGQPKAPKVVGSVKMPEIGF